MYNAYWDLWCPRCLTRDAETCQFVVYLMSRNVRKRTFGHVRRAKIQIRIFIKRILDSQGCKISSCGQRRLWSDCTDAQDDLNLRRAYMSASTFANVMALIILYSLLLMLGPAKIKLILSIGVALIMHVRNRVEKNLYNKAALTRNVCFFFFHRGCS